MKKATKRPKNVTQVAVCRHFKHHTVFNGCWHQLCPHYCLGQGTGATLTFGNALYCTACSVWGFPNFNLRNTAVFYVGRLSTQWKRISKYCLQQRCLNSNEFSSALTKHVLLCPCDLCVCAFHCILNCVYVRKCRNAMWLVNIAITWLDYLVQLQIRKDLKKWKCIYAQPVCVDLCAHAWVKLCVLMLFVWAYVVALLRHVVVSWLATEDSK